MGSADLKATARIWHESWHISHRDLVPKELTEHRGPQQFIDRLEAFGDAVLLYKEDERVLGMCIAQDCQIHQLFVSQQEFGKGIASKLLIEGELMLAKEGCAKAHLHCAQGNMRAIAFYQKHGWTVRGCEPAELDAGDGTFVLDCLVFEKPIYAI